MMSSPGPVVRCAPEAGLPGGDLVILTRSGFVARSPSGTSWTWVGSVNQLTVTALANDTPQRLLPADHRSGRPLPGVRVVILD